MEPAFTPALKWTIAGLTTAFVTVAVWLGIVVYRNAHWSVAQLPTAQQPLATSLVEPPAVIRDALNQAENQRAEPTNIVADTPAVKPTGTKLEIKNSEPANQSAETRLSATLETATAADGVVDATVTANLPILVSWMSRDCRSAKGGEKKNVDTTQRFSLSASDTRTCPHWTVMATTAGKQTVSFRIDVTSPVAVTLVPQPTPAVSVSTTSTNGQTTVVVTANEPVRLGIDSEPTGELATSHRRTVRDGSHTLIARTADGRQQQYNVSGSSASVSSR